MESEEERNKALKKALLEAAKGGFPRGITYAIEAMNEYWIGERGPIEIDDEQGISALHHVVNKAPSNSYALDALLEKLKEFGFTLDIEKKNNADLTALDLAIDQGKLEIVLSLLDAGAVVNARSQESLNALFTQSKNDYSGKTPLQMFVSQERTFRLFVQLLEQAAKQGISLNVNAINESTGRVVLHDAARRNDVRFVRTLLAQSGNAGLDTAALDINAKDHDGKTAVHHAIYAPYNAGRNITALHEASAAYGFDLHFDEKDHSGRTALDLAVTSNKIDSVKALIAAGADIEAADSQGGTALGLAVAQENLEIVIHLLAAGARVDGALSDQVDQLLMSKDDRNMSALHLAVLSDDPQIITALFKQFKARYLTLDVNERDQWDSTALLMAVDRGDSQVINALFEQSKEHGYELDINAQDTQGMSALHLAVASDDLQVINALLEQSKEHGYELDINAKDTQGMSALHFAVASDDLQVINALFEQSKEHGYELDINAQDTQGMSVWNLANQTDNPEVISTLLEQSRVHALKQGSINEQDDWGDTALHGAANRGNAHLVWTLLDAGADPAITNKVQSTALHGAAVGGHVEALKQLLMAGVYINPFDKYGHTPLMLAANNNNINIVKSLLEYSKTAGVDLDLNAQDSQGMSALGYAAKYGHLEMMVQLLDAGAVLNEGDNLAELKKLLRTGGDDPNKDKVMAHLLDAGAVLNTADNLAALKKLLGTEGDDPNKYKVMAHLLDAGAVLNTADNLAELKKLLRTGGDDPNKYKVMAHLLKGQIQSATKDDQAERKRHVRSHAQITSQWNQIKAWSGKDISSFDESELKDCYIGGQDLVSCFIRQGAMRVKSRVLLAKGVKSGKDRIRALGGDGLLSAIQSRAGQASVVQTGAPPLNKSRPQGTSVGSEAASGPPRPRLQDPSTPAGGLGGSVPRTS
jgi:uncharacterized protein